MKYLVVSVIFVFACANVKAGLVYQVSPSIYTQPISFTPELHHPTPLLNLVKNGIQIRSDLLGPPSVPAFHVYFIPQSVLVSHIQHQQVVTPVAVGGEAVSGGSQSDQSSINEDTEIIQVPSQRSSESSPQYGPPSSSRVADDTEVVQGSDQSPSSGNNINQGYGPPLQRSTGYNNVAQQNSLGAAFALPSGTAGFRGRNIDGDDLVGRK